jgi:type II secretory pathway pseudopilin PulG
MSSHHANSLSHHQHQAGFGLLELMLAAMIAAGITLGYLYNQSRQSAISQAQSQAGYYQMVSDAVAKYMANNYDQLKAITQPQTCSAPPLFTDATAAPAPTGCGIQALFLSGSTSSPVANGLQPTLAELKTTGYLDANFSNSFLWPTQLTMYAASGVKTGSSYAAPEYRVQIQAWCNGAAPSTDEVCDKPVLHSLVYNAQPFAANTDNSFINFTRLDKLMQARTALGANAFISYDWALQKDKLIYSDGNKNQLPNLLTFTSGSDSGIGVEGVLVLQATYMPALVSPAPPTPTPVVWTSQVPFSECNPQTDTLAVASMTVARARPIGNMDPRINSCPGVDTSPKQYKRAGRTLYHKFQHERWFITAKGAALVCKLNTAETNGYCPPPPGWRVCVTRVEKASSPPFPTHPWVKSRPIDDLNTKQYCWQAVKEPFMAQQSPALNPNWDSSLEQTSDFENGPVSGLTGPNNSWSLFWWLGVQHPKPCTDLSDTCWMAPTRLPR